MKRWFIAIVAAQLLFLVGEAGYYQWTIATGTPIALRVVPIDPRSLFLGNYMAMNYDISRIDLDKLPEPPETKPFQSGETLYAVLEPRKPTAVLIGVTRELPAASVPNRVFLKGVALYADGRTLNVEYGLERYYIPERRQDEVNAIWSAHALDPEHTPVTAEVSVSRNGQGFLRSVSVKGKTLAY